jgi:proline iminopeptidase
VLASTLTRFGPEQDRAMRAGMEKRLDQPWAQDAFAALEAEQAGKFESDQELSELVLREYPLYFAHYGAIEAGYVDTLRTEIINADALKLFNQEIFTTFDLRNLLPNITAPALVITGDEDFICGPVCSDDICTGIKSARKVIVGDSGHMVFVEQPQAFHDEVADFLSS